MQLVASVELQVRVAAPPLATAFAEALSEADGLPGVALRLVLGVGSTVPLHAASARLSSAQQYHALSALFALPIPPC